MPYATEDFLLEYLHEHTGGRLSIFLKKNLIRIRLIYCARARRGNAHLGDSFIKKDSNKYFTEMFPNFIQTAGAVDGASTCAKLVNMIHDQP